MKTNKRSDIARKVVLASPPERVPGARTGEAAAFGPPQPILLLDSHYDQERNVSDAANASNKPRRPRRPEEARGTPARDTQDAAAGGHSGAAQDKLGRALSDLLENPLVTGAIGRAWGAREKAAQAQEIWMGALNLPSAADIERLTRRLRAVSQRLEGVEDGVQRLGRSIVQNTAIEARLQTIDERLAVISEQLGEVRESLAIAPSSERADGGSGTRAGAGAVAGSRSTTTGAPPAARARSKR
jgi:hypothetical protein